ncbi:MAG: response regulator transcription factor [Chloroflexi bacterium]|nr:response regulator transcription factor [Chloroflexota bacterium]
MKAIRLLVVDDHALFRSGLISLLKGMPDFQIVGEAGNGLEAIEAARKTHPDVVLLDVNMPVMGGVEAVRGLKAITPCRIIMLTISKNDDDLFGAILAGADGYLLKDATPTELAKGIQQVFEGMGVLSPDVTRRVMGAVRSEAAQNADRVISNRELEVLQCLAQGKTTAHIAHQLFISENTVKTHVRHIMEKLDASNRAEAVSKAVQAGLIRQD